MAQQWLIIECMFGDAKTRGLNLEHTRLTHPRKLALLMALVALGYFARSWFRAGFDRIRNVLSSDTVAAIDAWRRLQKPPATHRQKPGVV